MLKLLLLRLKWFKKKLKWDYKYRKGIWDYMGNEKKRYDVIVNLIKESAIESPRILDLGCGPGYFMDQMKKREYTNVTGVTLSPGDIKICEDKGHKIAKYDLSFLPQKDGYFDESVDFIFLRHALEHSPYPIFSIMEYNRVLKQNGKIYIEVPAPNCDRRHEWNLNHYSILGEQQLAALLTRCRRLMNW